MSIESVSRASAASSASSTALNDQKSIAENFDVFLKLLTTQLKNQNPLEPLKTNEFTQQMVQFTQVEQQVKQNKNLEELGNLFRATALTSTVSYIGKNVTADGDTTNLKDGEAKWDVEFEEAPDESSVVISDKFGKVVYSSKTDFKEGINDYSWNGQLSQGGLAPEGLYTININATNAAGDLIDGQTMISGVVTGVDMTGETSVLNLGDRSVKLDNVRKIAA